MTTKLCIGSVALVMALALVGCKGNNNVPSDPSNPQNPVNPENLNAGAFSVDRTESQIKQVFFSKGNLQYNSSSKSWRFAENQWDVIGGTSDQINTLDGYIDMFGWGTGSNPLSDVADGNFVDWGTNSISNGGGDKWYTLTNDEWLYLILYRQNAQNLFALGTVDGIRGLILLPDDWVIPEGITFVPSSTKGLENKRGGGGTDGYLDRNGADHFIDNVYTLQHWEIIEKKGAVFLPCNPNAEPNTADGIYWSSDISFIMENYAKALQFAERELGEVFTPQIRKASVRLVRDASATK